MSRIAIGTKINAIGKTWEVLACGNGRYTVRAEGEKMKWTMTCSELHNDIAKGVAVVL
jgi:hypothetical protein